MPPSPPDTFEEALAAVAEVDGWMTDGQARLLWDRASALADGDRIVEIGSYRGRSAIVLASAADPAVEVVAIDPHAGNDRGPQEIDGSAAEGDADHETFVANLRGAGVADRVRHVRLPSSDAGGEVAGPIALLYIDGAHRYRPASDDIRGWGARVADGGTMLIHDSFSSIGVTLAQVRTLFLGRSFTYCGRSRSMAEYRREPVRGRRRLANLARQAASLPWFVHNVAIKALLVARLGPLTRLLGHRSDEWPY